MKKRNNYLQRVVALALSLLLTVGLWPGQRQTAQAFDMGKASQTNTVSARYLHTAAVKTDGSLWMWGWNKYGQLGTGDTDERHMPVKVLDGVAAVGVGRSYSAALKMDGSLWMWGLNKYGQLGTGDTDNRHTPVKVLDGVAAVSAGDFHTAALKTDGSLWMWGDNEHGQLGTGDTEDCHTPVKVLDGVMLSSGADITLQPIPREPEQPVSEYIYDAPDPGADVVLNTVLMNTVTDTDSAVAAVQNQTRSMSTTQKESSTGADLATLYAETAAAKAASKPVEGGDILINKAAVTELAELAKQSTEAVESALVEGGISTARYLAKTVTLTMEETGEISIRIDPDILTADVDKIVVEAPTYALSFKMEDLRDDLTEVLTFTAQDVGAGFAPGGNSGKAGLKIEVPNGKLTNTLTASLPGEKDGAASITVVDTNGEAAPSKYNPARDTQDGRISKSGTYMTKKNEVDFSDISRKSTEMQNAIRYLASQEIIGGVGEEKFNPDGIITRAEIAKLLVKAIGRLDNGVKPTFTDVTTADWFYAVAGSSQRAKLVNGYEDNTFRGKNQINKEQIVVLSARVLKSEMNYKTPANPAKELGNYKDTVVEWARPEVALATQMGLVPSRIDGTFSGSKGMTRGDAAIIIYRLYMKVWP